MIKITCRDIATLTLPWKIRTTIIAHFLYDSKDNDA